MPILMLSGAKDEVVPKEHMQALWEVVARRGEKKKLNGSEYEIGLKRAKYMEFEDGTHSKLDDLMPGVFLIMFLDDTCVQPGYWTAVTEFMTSVVAPMQSSRPRPF
jgi:abhydrolase domain-containing protein 13